MSIDPALLGVVAFACGGLFVEWIHARQRARENAYSAMIAQQAARMQQQQTRIDALEQYIEDHSDGDDEGELRRMFGGTDD
jgi:cell division protein FtsB